MTVDHGPASSSPDPIDDPQGYQRHLLGLLGDDDPVAVQRTTPGEWRTIADLAGADLHTAPAEGEWSVFGCLAHAVDAEIVMSGRYRWVLAHDEPQIIGYDQDLWVHGGCMPTPVRSRPSNCSRCSGSCGRPISSCGVAAPRRIERASACTRNGARRATLCRSA